MKKVLLSIALATIGSLSMAQQPGGTLTFDDALNIALENNPSIEAIQREEAAAKRERQAAIGLRMPQINVFGTYTYLGKDIGIDFNSSKGTIGQVATDFITEGVTTGLITPQMAQLLQSKLSPLLGMDLQYTIQDRSLGFIGGEVTVPIFMGGKINAANRAAQINEQSAIMAGNSTRNALVSELVERYFGLSLAMQVVDVRRQVLDGVEVHLHDAEAMEEQGMIARSEKLYVEFKLAEAQRELENARLQVATLQSALANTLGQTVDTNQTPVSVMFVLDRIESVDYYKDMARDNNPLLSQVGLKRDLAEQGVRAQRADFFPQIVAMGGGTFYNYQVTNILPRWAVGIGFNFKIFDGLNREYKYSAAKQTVRRVESLQTKAQQDISVLIEKLYNQLVNYANQMTSIEASIAFAEEYLRMKNEAFLEGMCSSSDLIDAELNLAKVKTERMQAAYGYDLALAKLLEAAGLSDEFTQYARRADARPITFDLNR